MSILKLPRLCKAADDSDRYELETDGKETLVDLRHGPAVLGKQRLVPLE